MAQARNRGRARPRRLVAPGDDGVEREWFNGDEAFVRELLAYDQR